MRSQKYETQLTRRLLTYLFGVVAGCAVAAQPASSEEGSLVSSGQTRTGSDTSAPQPTVENPAAGPENASGMKIYVDPRTGAVRQEPAPGTPSLQITPETRNALSTSHRGLVQTPSSVPGGGVKLDLQGRFQSPLVVGIGPDGKARMHHLGEPPAPAAGK